MAKLPPHQHRFSHAPSPMDQPEPPESPQEQADDKRRGIVEGSARDERLDDRQTPKGK